MQDEVFNLGSASKNKPDSSISSGKEKSAASQLIDRYFRQVAKQYAERIKPLESTLQTYQEVREVQSVVTAALVQLAADIRNHPTALREAVSFRREMRKLKHLTCLSRLRSVIMQMHIQSLFGCMIYLHSNHT